MDSQRILDHMDLIGYFNSVSMAFKPEIDWLLVGE